MIAVGSILPWASINTIFGTASASGLEGGDGVITLLLGLGALATGVMIATGNWTAGRAAKIGLWITVAPIAVIWTVDFVDIWNKVSIGNDFAIGSIGSGLWLMLAGIGAFLVGLLNLKQPTGATPSMLAPDAAPPHRLTSPIAEDRDQGISHHPGKFHVAGEEPVNVAGSITIRPDSLDFVVSGSVIESLDRAGTKVTRLGSAYRISTDDDEAMFTPANPWAFDKAIADLESDH